MDVPSRIEQAVKTYTPHHWCVWSLIVPLIGPLASVPTEQIAIMAPIRRPMRPMLAGVVCATQAEPSGTMPPEENPNRSETVIIAGSVDVCIQHRVAMPVRVDMQMSMLNLDRNSVSTQKSGIIFL